jgi:methylase of polypeptide subunit release factors
VVVSHREPPAEERFGILSENEMTKLADIKPPVDLDWEYWVDSWDRMQERYLVERRERFETVVHLIRETQHSVRNVLDLGCGTGSLMSFVLDAFPEAQVMKVDFDLTILWLAAARLTRFGGRWHGISTGPASAAV